MKQNIYYLKQFFHKRCKNDIIDLLDIIFYVSKVGWALVAHHFGAQTKIPENPIPVGINAHLRIHGFWIAWIGPICCIGYQAVFDGIEMYVIPKSVTP